MSDASKNSVSPFCHQKSKNRFVKYGICGIPIQNICKKNSFTTRYSRSYRIRIVTVLGQDRLSSKRYKLILDILFRSKDVEKSGTGFQRVNDFCKQQNVTWSYRKEAYGFFFEFIRTNVQINVQINTELTEAEQVIFNLIKNNDGISKAEMAIRIGKSEKTVQRLISSLIKKQVIEREGSNKSGSWKIKI